MDKALLERQNAEIKSVCDEIALFLSRKNTSYEGSAFRDIAYGGKIILAEDAIDCRINDKIKRLQSSDPSFDGEDSEKDLLGYLIVKLALKRLRISEK
jgi:hypothetical protein